MAMLSHDLSEELVARLGSDYPPDVALSDFAARIGKNADPATLDAVALEVFGNYGAALMKRALELGEQYPDRAYEVLKAAAEKTGRLYFPHVAQRFVEIANLAIQPVARIDILATNHYVLTHRIGPRCVIFKGLRDTCGEAVSGQMPCRHACLGALRTLYRELRLDVSVAHEALLSKDGECRFAAKNNRPSEGTPWLQ